MIYFGLIILPGWLIARQLHKMAGSMLYPSLRPGPDHAHMAGRLITHLKENDYEKSQNLLISLAARTPAFTETSFVRKTVLP